MAQITRVAAYGLVLRDSKILLCRFSGKLPEFEGQWTLPGGGIDFGEDPADAVVREVREETGLTVEPTTLFGIDSFTDVHNEPARHGIRILYGTRIVSGQIRYEVDGTTDMCSWFTLDEAKSLAIVELVEVGLAFAFNESHTCK